MPEMRKAALVTGGAKRIGREIALHLAKNGYDIALHFNRSAEDAQKTAAEIEQLSRRCYLVKADLGTASELESVIESCIGNLPYLSVLINNASTWSGGLLTDSSCDEFDEQFHLHVRAPFILTRDFARMARKGNIINILDSNVAKKRATEFAYLLSKKSLQDLTIMAAVELAPAIRVNSIAPGMVLAPEKDKNKPHNNPLNKTGSPKDVTNAIDFFLHNETVTGQCVFVAGGKDLI
ncbi:MAG: SDR family NAD(P)-dependent oxidoreductase [Candidatus Obscuribacterales bacterium]|jgi:NAD(P)-dependent dehydrogenase (short-subunit alcohol dehydrogenase family)|nr:SDR family NAD(P)-dependent oxidoreductase [Candidatus Obscuribacterales bacterium]